MNYPYNIASIGQIHPEFAQNPHIRDIRLFEGVNASAIIGTPVNPLAAADAASTVKILLGVESEGFFFSCGVHQRVCTMRTFYLFMCRELTIDLCLGSLPGVVTSEVIETARNREHVLRDTREWVYCAFEALVTVLQMRR